MKTRGDPPCTGDSCVPRMEVSGAVNEMKKICEWMGMARSTSQLRTFTTLRKPSAWSLPNRQGTF
jgi:hypothetical protein